MADSTQKLTSKAEGAVAVAIAKPSTPASIEALPAIMNALIPVIEEIVNSTALKPWYQSKTAWSGIVAIIVGLLGLLGYAVPPSYQAVVLTMALPASSAVAAGLAFYSRYKQNKAAKAAVAP